MDLNLDEFFAGLAVVQAQFFPSDQRKMARDGAAQHHGTAYGARFWSGSVQITPEHPDDAAPIEARLALLTEADGRFRVCPVRMADAVSIAGTVAAVNAGDRRRVELSNDAGIGVGSWVGITDQGGGLHLHRVGAQVGAEWVVTPALRLSVAAGDVTEYGRPELWARIDAGGVRWATHDPAHANGIGFKFVEDRR